MQLGNVIRATCLMFLLFAPLQAFATGEAASGAASDSKPADSKPAREVSPTLRAAIEKLELPGVKINLDEWCVDVDARVCLTDGMLELIVCTKDTKEHESIFVIDAKPSHIHTALLLLGAQAGNPAAQRMIEGDKPRFVSIPPSGHPIQVFVVQEDPFGKKSELPISDFIVPTQDQGLTGVPTVEGEAKEPFATHTFLFAGSVLVGEGTGPRRYLCDSNGNVISISTFGDELLCLPGFHESANSALVWSANSEKLPPINTKVILRLRPVFAEEAPAGSKDPVPADK